ncbi:hypothetical protein KIH86_20460 [Paenibacillus sp. HN-1]|uniref:hypothetical protein n=1 Tax=Paenibacillus TaxID=44249 RepID=UPI001CA8750A|nr:MULTISPECIES: hypothetical protein [Paenibacillus]MBY9077047.1 hypothetical protein [Paenibacillus sp. CGMCC 1.18879]MBY9086580.1 hypothetical protein [Paenibacillus sinensis]
MKVLIVLLVLFSPFAAQSAPAPSALSVPADYALHTASAQAVRTVEDRYIRTFDSLAGVPLYATTNELIELKGQPLAIVPDPWEDSLEFRYADMSAGITAGAVSYIHVSPEQVSAYGLKLNGREIDPLRDTLKDTLGSPDFAAEDGDVYMRGHMALKVYVDRQTGQWRGIDLFDDYSD